jgi:hypothetical protein
MRSTSIEAYHQVCDSGLVSRTRLVVYTWLYEHGPATANETESALAGPDRSRRATSFHKRFSELEKMGLIAVTTTRSDKITGVRCTEWDVTANMPQPLARRESLHARLVVAERERDDLRREVVRLRNELEAIRTVGNEIVSGNYAQGVLLHHHD